MTEDIIRILEEIRNLVTRTINTEYRLTSYSLFINDEPLYKAYTNKVTRILSGEEDQTILKELWRSDDLSRSLFAVKWNPDPGIKISTSERFIESIDILSEDLLGQRYRGFYHSAKNEGFLNKERYLDSSKIRKIIECEELSKYPLTCILLQELSRILTKLGDKHNLELGIVIGYGLDRDDAQYRYRDVQGFFHVVPYYVKSDLENRVQEVLKRIFINREFWEEWLRAREEIACNLGIDEGAFMVRDLLERMFGLPIWTVMVKPASGGWDLVIDISYASLYKNGLNDEQLFNMPLLKGELRKTDMGRMFRIYGSPIPFGLLTEDIIRGALVRLIEFLKDKNEDIIKYLFNRSHIDEIAEISPPLADILISLINLIDEKSSGLRITPVQVEYIWPDTASEAFDMWPISTDCPYYNSYYKPSEWEFIEISLTTDVEYSDNIVDFTHTIVEAAAKLNRLKKRIEDLLEYYKRRG